MWKESAQCFRLHKEGVTELVEQHQTLSMVQEIF